MITKIDDFVAELDRMVAKIKKGPTKNIDFHGLSEKLKTLAEAVDPIRQPPSVFDPGDPQMIGRVTSCALLLQPKLKFSDLKTDKFYGSGIYSIYYNGAFAPYRPISGTETPIYVGKADPRDPAAPTPRSQGVKIHGRLTEHLRSIEKAENLEAEDFEFRFLVVKSGMQGSAEEYLINYFKPIWNSQTKICFGVGKHGDSAKTRGNKRSPWDALHPGRKWADLSLEDQKTVDRILSEIYEHFQKHPPIKVIDYKALLTG